ncbi:MAG: anti-virulence regulator CigR family protein [Morganella sp. (in: enterobacteria)]|uniref:anti-virulence regulator CigR family protein n=1 Tax=Morganella morganii TaxID=582 RepID=UPI00301C358A
MSTLSGMSRLLLVLVGLSIMTPLSYADPNKGHGQNKNYQKEKHSKNKNKSHQNDFDSGSPLTISLTYKEARGLALDGGFTGYASLPPGIAKNLARGKPLPPGIAKKMVPTPMLSGLPHYVGYEWRIVGNDLVLIALSTAIVTSIINNVFY